jgi:hypothetical protein
MEADTRRRRERPLGMRAGPSGCTAIQPGCCRRHPRLCLRHQEKPPSDPPSPSRSEEPIPYNHQPSIFSYHGDFTSNISIAPTRALNTSIAPPRPPGHGALNTSSIAPNLVRINHVCFYRRDGHRSTRSDPSPVIARVWKAGHTVDSLCRSLTACHKPEAFAFCRSTPHSQMAEAFLQKASSFHVSTVRTTAECRAFNLTAQGPRRRCEPDFPPAGATVVGRAAIVRLTGNIGHDLLLESFLDFFSQQQHHAEQQPRRKRQSGQHQHLPGEQPAFFDALLLEAFWFKGHFGFKRALNEPSSSWSFTMLSALLAAPRRFLAHHYKMRPDHRPASDPARQADDAAEAAMALPPGGLCVRELYVRAKLEAGHAAWGNLRHVPEMAAVVRGRLGLAGGMAAATAAATSAAAAASPPLGGGPQSSRGGSARVVVFTRGDAASRRLLFGPSQLDQLRAAVPGCNLQVVHALRAEDARSQVELFASADVLIAPHGASSANTIFMRPGSAFVELTPFCDATCLSGCYSAYTRAGPRGDSHGIFRALRMPRLEACRLVRSVYPPFHAHTGVSYFVLSLCREAVRPAAVAGSCSAVGQKAFKHEESGKYLNLTDSHTELLHAVLRYHLDGVTPNRSAPRQVDASGTTSTELAPFAFSCRPTHRRGRASRRVPSLLPASPNISRHQTQEARLQTAVLHGTV